MASLNREDRLVLNKAGFKKNFEPEVVGEGLRADVSRMRPACQNKSKFQN